MIFECKTWLEGNSEFMIDKGFAFFPTVISRNEKVWLKRYERTMVFNTGSWMVYDRETHSKYWDCLKMWDKLRD